jgi:acetyl esterase/lipase
MLRSFPLLFAALWLALGVLTAVPSPDWLPWQLAVLAGEYGHWIALPALAVGGIAFGVRRRAPAVATATLLLSLAAAGLLLKPCFQAWHIARRLPAEFARAFPGTPRSTRKPFSVSGLFARLSTPAAVRTLHFSEGLALDFYAPALRAARLAPCVIVVHGGGWDSGERTQFASFNHALAARGFAVAAIDYRLAPAFTWPAQRDDLLAAIAFLKTHAAELGLDPARLVLFGRSAGGQIAEAVAYSSGDPAIRGAIAFYAPADLEFAWTYAREDDVLKSPGLMHQFLGGTPAKAPAAFRSASGYLAVTPHSPPTLLLHGQLDPLVWHRQSERLAQHLAENRVPHVFVSLPWATHAFDFNLDGPGGQLALWSVEEFLATVVGPPGS